MYVLISLHSKLTSRSKCSNIAMLGDNIESECSKIATLGVGDNIEERMF